MAASGTSVDDVGDPAATAGADSGLFVRKSSGLVREMGWRDAISVALSGINPTTVVAIFFAVLIFDPNTSLTGPYVLAALVMVPLTITYGQLVASLPRSGGDFVYMSRIFGPLAGAVLAGAILMWFALNLGTNSVFVGQLFLPEFFTVAGSALHVHAFTSFASTLGSHTAEFITASVIVLIGCLVGTRGAHALGRAMFWCFVAGIIGVVLVLFEALTHSHAAFQTAYDHATAPGAYAAVLAATHKAGISTGNTFSGFLKVMPFVATGFWGLTYCNFPAGEIKRPGKTYVWATLIGLATAVVIFELAWLAIEHLAGLQFMKSAAALSATDPAAFAHATGGASTLTQFYADVVSSSPVVRVLMSGGFVIGGMILPLVMILVLSRLIFALSFDRLLPTKLADVSERTHAPLKALAVCAAGGMAMVALVVYSTGYLRISRNGIVVFALWMTVVGIAGAALAHRRKDLYEASPKIVNRRWLGLPAVTVISAVTILTQGALAYYAITNNALSGGYDAGSIVYLVCTALVGVVLYAVSRTYLRRAKGIDIDLAMHELPPE